MENEKQKLLNESDYQEGESCSYYMNEIGAFKTGFNKGAEWMHAELWSLIEQARKAVILKGGDMLSISYEDSLKLLEMLEQFEKGE